MPSADKLFSLAAELECSVMYLMGQTDDPTPTGNDLVAVNAARERKSRPPLDIVEQYNRVASVLGSPTVEQIEESRQVPEPLEYPQRMVRDIPVYGTALGGDAAYSEGEGGEIVVEQTDLNTGDVIDYFRRPPGLSSRKKVYGLYVSGTSMEPAFEAGAPLIVDPTRTPSIRDYVVVYLRNGEEEDDAVSKVLVKRLMRRSSSFIELEQFNPHSEFRVSTKNVVSLHRVVPLAEIISM